MRALPGRYGKVTLVGAGPGDPELLTVKGLRALREAQVVVYDRLVSPALLEEASDAAERVYVGKRGGHYCYPQEQIHRLLLDRARQGLEVVRLKGGDPFLFGRGAEEVVFLRERGVACEVIPGISSALAAPAAAGISVTQRGKASSVAIVSGHQMQEATNPTDWRLLASGTDTLIVMMALSNLRAIVGQLIGNGRSLMTPAAVIQAATTPQQRVAVAPLREIAARVEREGFTSPALLIVGEVVRGARSDEVTRTPAPEASEIAGGTA